MRGRISVVAVVALLACAEAARASELVTIDVPTRHVDPGRVMFNSGGALKANVLLPDGYDAGRAYPVLYLLHGVGDAYTTWAKPANGNVAEIARGLDAIVVMPEAARGFYTDWWNEGRRGDPGWESYYLEDLIPLIERRFRIRPERRWHAIAGLSMGGMGATFLASRLPGYFGSAATFSGFVAHQRPEIPIALQALGVDYEQIFGPLDGFYATGHNPARLTDNLRHTRLFVSVGDGTARLGVDSSPGAVLGGGATEAGLRIQNDDFVQAARESGVSLLYRPHQGVHDWPYWREDLSAAIAWGLFEPVAEQPASWTYRTVAREGEMWGLSFAFAEPPERGNRFTREPGGKLTGAGAGTVTLRTARECAVTARLPFEIGIPTHRCGPRIAVRVTPRVVRRLMPTTLRFRVSARGAPLPGARVRFGARAVRTDRHGRAVMRVRLAGRRGIRSVTATKAAHIAGRAQVRVTASRRHPRARVPAPR